MRLDIEKIKKHLESTEEEFANEMNISLDELRQYCEGTSLLSSELLSQMCQYTGLQPSEGGLFIAERPKLFKATTINPNDTYKPSRQAKEGLVDYIKRELPAIQEETIRAEIEKIQSCVNTLRKPRISFAGQSDTGKSTLINALLGAEKMPAKWTPTTSIVVHIKHIDDRPDFIKEDVWILGKKNGEIWDDTKLNDEQYCKEFLVAKGDFSLLSDFGTHQGEKGCQQLASSAVAFIDSKLLKNCDILDLPGFAATAEDDALHRFNTQENVTDILLYLSRSNGFLQDRDLDYLRECLKSLRPIEKKDQNNLGKLCNLFVIASQAGAVNNGNSTDLSEIMDRRCNALCESYALAASISKSKSLLPIRSTQTGYEYMESDFRARFFTYEKDMGRLCKKFNSDFTILSEEIPRILYEEFCHSLEKIVICSKDIVQERYNEWKDLLCNREKYAELAREIKQKEPARKIEQKRRVDGMLKRISDLSAETKQKIQSMYDQVMNTDYIVELLDKRNVKNKKSDREDFASTINELLTEQVRTILAEKTNEYCAELDNYLNDYAKTFTQYTADTENNVKFNTTNSFALGITSLGALGASAAWLATSYTTWSVIALGTHAGWASILAVGGMIGIAIGAVIASVIVLVRVITWKKEFAKAIIDAYKKKEYLSTIFTDVEKYWNDTKESFKAGSDKVEKDWQERIADYESIADEKNIPALKAKIQEAQYGLNFFIEMPLPKNG